MKIAIIGAGPGGYIAAIRAAQLGAEVVIVEKEHMGGTCLNIGCIPTKCLLHSAELAEAMRNQGKEIGVEADNLRVNFPQVIKHKSDISHRLVSGVEGLMRANKVKIIRGEAKFTGIRKVEVTSSDGKKEALDADKLIIATGSVNFVPPIPGIEGNPAVIDSTGALSLETLPKSMVVVGGGVIGVELACAYAGFGTKVTIVEALDHILPMLDSDLTKVGMQHMQGMGIEFHLSTPVQSIEKNGDGAVVVCKDPDGKEIRFEAEKVLVAVGRRGNTKSLDLSKTGIETTRKGQIEVDDHMQTKVAGIYAIGDCTSGHAELAHTASAMGEVAVENIMGIPSVYDETTNPTCVYMEPEAASVGFTEEQAKSKGIDYKVGKFPMAANGKSLILNGGEGLVKIIAGKKYGEVLGMHIIGPRATDLISEGALAIDLEATVDELIETIHSHPTVSETVREAALDVENRVLNMPPKK
ncbi:MAG: dihydrolipoyl dehydrogenase [Eubacteriales bacterium]|nr:dihydrolipoyl dehydrogenase [Eubacteriales bacterium]